MTGNPACADIFPFTSGKGFYDQDQGRRSRWLLPVILLRQFAQTMLLPCPLSLIEFAFADETVIELHEFLCSNLGEFFYSNLSAPISVTDLVLGHPADFV